MNEVTQVPLISIVMPLYNKALDVLSSVESVQAQSVTDWQLIVVDDGSTDGGADLVRSVSDKRILVIGQENSGVSAARNCGIQHAAADLVAFLDADDLWQPGFLQCVLHLRRDFPEAKWFATAYEVRPKNGLAYVCRLRGLPQGFTRGLIPAYFALAARSDPPVCSSAVAVTKQVLTGIGGFPVGLRSGEDLLTWARLATQHRLAYDLRPLAAFVVSGIERAPDALNRAGLDLETLAREHPAQAGIRAYVALWYRMQATMAMRFQQVARARVLLLKSLRYDPLALRGVYGLLTSYLPSLWRTRIDTYARKIVVSRNRKQIS